MPSSEFSRAATASFLTIWLTRKCLPMSRRKSSADIGAVQSRLLTKTAGLSPSTSRNGSHLSLDVGHPLGRLLLGLEDPLGRRPRVADQPGRAADEADDPVPGPLQVAQHDELHEVAEVQGRRGRVEAAVRRDRPVGECLAQRGLVGGLGHQSPPLQLVEDVAHGGLLLRVADVPRVAARAQPALCACACVHGVLRGRYAETVGSPSSQNRQGYAAASPPAPDTPTRGPVRTRRSPHPRDRDPRSATGPRGIQASRPDCSPRRARVVARRAGPRAQSRRAIPGATGGRDVLAGHHLAGAQQDRAGLTRSGRTRRWRTSACRR